MNKKPPHIWLENEIKKIQDQLESKKLETKPSLLIHACCGPCSSYVLEYLQSVFDISLFFYNPNIYPQTEYERRKDELLDFVERFNNEIAVIVEKDYESEVFYESTGVKQNPELQKEKERGERCRRCYEFRMKKAYDYAKSHNFDYFTTTLSISPHKDAQKINEIGQKLQDTEKKPQFLYSDFKKNRGFLRSTEISKEYNLYRQEYCGCVYSIRDSIEE